jgi:hypothetical protein
MPNSTLTAIHGEPSLPLQSDQLKLWITQRGAHLAPVTFQLPENRSVEPYSLAPWTPDEHPDHHPVLQILRGDFFCFPFAATPHTPHLHGEPANLNWRIDQHLSDLCKMSIDLPWCSGTIDKTIQLRAGQRVIYQEHCIRGVNGRFNYAHHPILHCPSDQPCPVRTSPRRCGAAYVGAFTEPALGEYSILKPGSPIHEQGEVTLLNGELSNIHQYPAREGFEDMAMLAADTSEPLGWTAVTFPGYVWIALRSIRQFPVTLFWLTNGGRHQAPWCGRHRHRLGVEDAAAFHHGGPMTPEAQKLADQGLYDQPAFNANQPTVLRHTQFVHPVSGQPGLASLKTIPGEEAVKLTFEDGQTTQAAVDWAWLLEPDQNPS